MFGGGNMAVDIFHSRRTSFQRCVYYIRDEQRGSGDIEKLVLDKEPSGVFYAKEVSDYQQGSNDVGNAMFDTNRVTIETADDISLIKKGCIVCFRNNFWFVDNVGLKQHPSLAQFKNEVDGTRVLSLRK